ncbi:MAG TPA: hypothetical protein ENG28_04180, partial [Deltaproteobacteria bacterium]|nr:hypothetical protein [Deltaproteobacteria bacterium]
SDFSGSEFIQCVFKKVNLSSSDMQSTKFFFCMIEDCSLKSCNMKGSAFDLSFIINTVVDGSDLTNTSFLATTLRHSGLTNSLFQLCDLTLVDAKDLDLTGTQPSKIISEKALIEGLKK